MGKPRKWHNKTLSIEVLVEGHDEKEYFDRMKRDAQFRSVAMTIKTENMSGGGYSAFLEYVKKNSAARGCIARFIVIDYDRCLNTSGEKEPFRKLVQYCVAKNKYSSTPYFLIVANPNLELLLCLHMDGYQISKDPDRFLQDQFKCQNIGEFKKKFIKENQMFDRIMQPDIKTAVERACQYMRAKPKVVSNAPKCKGTGVKIKFKNDKITWDENNQSHKNVNMDEFFKVVFDAIEGLKEK